MENQALDRETEASASQDRWLTTTGWITVVASCLIIIGFFLPWLSSYPMGIADPEMESRHSGLTFATMGSSNASELPGWPYLATLVVGLVGLVLGILSLRGGRDATQARAQSALAVVGWLPFILLRVEVGHWAWVGIILRLGLYASVPVSYTHLTLPTN